ncbi:hypothetical protein [Psychrobacter sp. UBA3962]|uniref:hypothetical protein n=1 Tax=Psychrobacter sp. UBA3962 TaxID=1947352 RepID=UPI0025EE48CD|nr:hypothetical protein [Psychrobacter sp. UBA3962]
MNNRVIKILDMSAYRNFKGWVTETNNVNPVFVASFAHPLENSLIDMYAKLYSFVGNNRSVFNEILGYLMADALGLPQPKHACIALLPTDKLKNNLYFKLVDPNLEKEIFSSEVFPVFCTSKINPSQTALQYHGIAQAVAKELAKWPRYSEALALDNTICHIDRHMNNILRTGVNKYHLIDNGILIDINGWSVNELNPNSYFINKLLDISKQLMSPKQYNSIKQEAVMACDDHYIALEKITEELKFWINALYGQHQSDYNKFLDFLDQRANNATGLLTSRLQMLI